MKDFVSKCFKASLLCMAFLFAFAIRANEVKAADSDFVIYDGVLVQYIGTNVHVVIPEGVTEIADRAFIGKGIYSVVIPDSTKIIGESAFESCKLISTLRLPQKLDTIKASAFKNCSNLTTLTVGARVIGENAFSSCYRLSDVTILGTVYSIQKSAFEYTAISRLTILNGLRSIGAKAFSLGSLTSVSIPASVTYISTTAFENNRNFANITVSSANTKLSSYDGCLYNKSQTSLYICPPRKTSIKIPRNTTNLSNKLLVVTYNNLTSITVDSRNKKYRSYGGCVYSKNMKTFLICPSVKRDVRVYGRTTSIAANAFNRCAVRSVSLPSTLTSIGKYAFQYNYGLQKINLPVRLRIIGDFAFSRTGLTNIYINRYVTSIGRQAFESCSKLSSIRVHPYNRKFADYNNCLYNKTRTILLKCPRAKKTVVINSRTRTLGFASLSGCSALTRVTLGKNVTTIGQAAFNKCYQLSSLKMYGKVRTIYAQAFAQNYALKRLNLPRSVKKISASSVDSNYTTLGVYRGSYAQRLANRYGLKYVIVR